MGEQEKENQTKNKKALKFFLILIIIAAVMGASYMKSKNISIIDYILSYQSDKVVAQVTSTQKFDIDSKSSFAVLGNSYVECNKDSIKYNGLNKWSQTYTMDLPTMVTEGNIVAVGELSKNNVYVFNEKGLLYNAVSDAPISQFVVNKLGYLIIMTESSTSLYTPYSNPVGAKLTSFERETEGIYPISADISNNGDYVAISYLDTTGSQIESKVLFYAVGIEGEAEYGADSVVNLSSIHEKDELIFNVSYMDNDTLIAIGDKKIIAAHNNEKVWEKTLTNKITALNLSSGKYIALGLGDELPGGSEFEAGTAIWYDLNGNQVGTYKTDKNIKLITSKANRVLVYAGKNIYALSLKGNLMWEYLALGDLKYMELFNNTSDVLLVYRNSAQIVDVKLKLYKNDEEESTNSSQNETKDDSEEEHSTTETSSQEEQSTEETSVEQEQSSEDDSTQESDLIKETSTEQEQSTQDDTEQESSSSEEE